MASLPRTSLARPALPKGKQEQEAKLKGTPSSIGAASAKTHLLKLLNAVERDRKIITITKRGRKIAQIGPVEAEPDKSAFDQIRGRSKGQITFHGDIVSPDWESWGPEWR